jgi:hypothetical protein
LIDGVFFRPDGAVIAIDLKHLLDTAATPLQNPIDIDESGATVAATQHVWTGTNADGSANANTCKNNQVTPPLDWASVSGGGWYGLPTTSSQWTAVGASSCDGSASLYCIEAP